MAYDRFLIAPIKSGLITEIKAWQIPEDAFTRLNNAYIYKGVVRKRFGSQLMGGTNLSRQQDQLASRLRIHVATTDGAGAASGTAPGTLFAASQMFSIDDEIFTVSTTGTPAVMLTTGSASTRTFNTTTGAYVFAGAGATKKVYFYPSFPVMGIGHYEENKVDRNATYAFDPMFAYKYTGGFWERSGTAVFKGDDTNFFWIANWAGVSDDLIAMFVTNFNATIGTPVAADDDPMYTFDGTTWSEFAPVFRVKANAPDGIVKSAKIILPFKNTLVLLNTIEFTVSTGKNTQHVNRCRYSRNGTAFPANGTNNAEASVSSAWLWNKSDTAWTVGATTKGYEGGGFLDAPVEEEIMSAEFIKDRLIVYFERSTWELAATGNYSDPFTWLKINTELGTKSLKSPIPFDKAIITIGRTGIHGCSGANVSKINDKISDFTFEIRKSLNGNERIAGIRDYFTELAYWAFPSVNAHTDSQRYPDKVLIYNYVDDSWGTADDCITSFGYFEEQTSVSWESTELTWEQANFKWDSGSTQSSFRQVVAGNQQGFMFICDSNISTNEAVMQITNVTDNSDGTIDLHIENHTMNDNDFLRLMDLSGINLDETVNYKVSVSDGATLVIEGSFTGTYLGGGRAARVSRIDILSKQWNFYIDKGSNFYLAKIDFAVLKTASGEVTVDYYPSASELSMIESGEASGCILGDNNLQTYPFDLYPLENSQKRLWHPVYFQTDGECVQIRIYLDDAQMADQSIAESDFQLEGLVCHTMKTSERLQ